MHVTTRFIGTKRGDFRYLFFLLTEDYIQKAKNIQRTLYPLLTDFARDLGEDGALVTPFAGDEKNTLGDALSKLELHSNYEKGDLANKLPVIMIIDVDFDDFDPRSNNHLMISLRDSMDAFGDVKVFEVRQLLNDLSLGARIDYLFQHMADVLKENESKEHLDLWKNTFELKPNMFGIGIDLKNASVLLKGIKERLT